MLVNKLSDWGIAGSATCVYVSFRPLLRAFWWFHRPSLKDKDRLNSLEICYVKYMLYFVSFLSFNQSLKCIYSLLSLSLSSLPLHTFHGVLGLELLGNCLKGSIKLELTELNWTESNWYLKAETHREQRGSSSALYWLRQEWGATLTMHALARTQLLHYITLQD